MLFNFSTVPKMDEQNRIDPAWVHMGSRDWCAWRRSLWNGKHWTGEKI